MASRTAARILAHLIAGIVIAIRGTRPGVAENPTGAVDKNRPGVGSAAIDAQVELPLHTSILPSPDDLFKQKIHTPDFPGSSLEIER